jgi:phosphatidylglycerophosphate synthase
MLDPAARRPLKSRGSAWAGKGAQLLLKWKFTPNAVSVLSVVFAALGGWALYLAPQEACAGCQVFWWIVAVAGIQLRLVCNLMDGLLAVEGGLKSAVGDLYNEVPDRVADTLLLVGAGYGVAAVHPWAADAGWAAAAGAMATAYARALGAGLTGRQDFRGPFAKQHRMAILTAACAAGAVEFWLNRSVWIMPVTLVVIAAGSVLTAARRLMATAAVLKSRGK